MNHIGGSYCFILRDMLRNISKKDMDFSKLANEKKSESILIIQDFMKLVLDDVIHNGVQFRFSTPIEAYIQIEGVYGEEFKKQRRNGRFYEIDPIKSNFTGHDLVMTWKGKRRLQKRSIAINYDLKDIIIDKTNDGYKY